MMQFVTYQSDKNIISLFSKTRNLFTTRKVKLQILHSIFEKSHSYFFAKLRLPVKTAIKKLLFVVQKRFKLKTKVDVDERFGCMLLLETIIVWLHVYSFKTAKLEDKLGGSTLGTANFTRKPGTSLHNQTEAHCVN